MAVGLQCFNASGGLTLDTSTFTLRTINRQSFAINGGNYVWVTYSISYDPSKNLLWVEPIYHAGKWVIPNYTVATNQISFSQYSTYPNVTVNVVAYR